jgi:hypothetical protein
MRSKIENGLKRFTLNDDALKQKIKTNLPVHSQKNNMYRKLILVVALFFVCSGGIYVYLLKQLSNDPTQAHTPPQNLNEVQQTSTIEELVETVPEVLMQPYTYLDDKTALILKYNYFYNNSHFGTELDAEILAYQEILRYYQVFYHMEKYNVVFPEEKFMYYYNRAGTYLVTDKKDTQFQNYLTFLEENHGITEQDYIDYFYFIEQKYTYLYRLLESERIGYNEQGEFPRHEAISEAEAMLGVKLQDLIREKEQVTKNLQENADRYHEDIPTLSLFPEVQFGYLDGKVQVVGIDYGLNTVVYDVYNIGDISYIINDRLYESDARNGYILYNELGSNLVGLTRFNFDETYERYLPYKDDPRTSHYVGQVLTLMRIYKDTVEFSLTRKFKGLID